MKVAILGCGPSGLLAAQSAKALGAEYEIFSLAKKSQIGGAQYLHTGIPGITSQEPDGSVSFVKRGTAEVYASKVYGKPDVDTSWLHYDGNHDIWSMRKVYDALWEQFHEQIQHVSITPELVEQMMLAGRYELVVSSINARSICYDDNHDFSWTRIRITPSAETKNTNIIIMNGVEGEPWYRSSMIFGVGGTEYPFGSCPQGEAVTVIKPLSTTCDCWGEILRVGRYGKWSKGVLAHEAYSDVKAALYAMH